MTCMVLSSRSAYRGLSLVVGFLYLTCSAPVVMAGEEARRQASDKVWEEQLRPASFADRPITVGAAAERLLKIKAPFRADDPSVVPIAIHTSSEELEDGQRISRLHLFLDKNPIPLIGVLELGESNGRADFATRVRVDDFTYLRAVAEVTDVDSTDSQLYMTKTFIRSVGGCSAPPGASMAESRKNKGKMKMRLLGGMKLEEPNLVQLQISHPNITGMAANPLTGIKPPAYFINQIAVEYDGSPVFSGNFTFSLSQDPSMRFFFVPRKRDAVMAVYATDTKGEEYVFEQTLPEAPQAADQGSEIKPTG